MLCRQGPVLRSRVRCSGAVVVIEVGGQCYSCKRPFEKHIVDEYLSKRNIRAVQPNMLTRELYGINNQAYDETELETELELGLEQEQEQGPSRLVSL